MTRASDERQARGRLGRLAEPLGRPFPTSRGLVIDTRRILVAGTIATAALLFLRPFGLASYPSSRVVPLILSFSAVSVAVALLNALLRPRLFAEERWTVGRHILFSLWNLLAIAAAILLVARSVGLVSITLRDFVLFAAVTVAIGAIPVTIETLATQVWLLKTALARSREVNRAIGSTGTKSGNRHVRITSRTGETLELSMREFVYAEAAENYVRVYRESSTQSTAVLLRATLTEIGEQLGDAGAIRCHRSFVVNPERVTRVQGNAQGYRLTLAGADKTIPVSRGRADVTFDRIASPAGSG